MLAAERGRRCAARRTVWVLDRKTDPIASQLGAPPAVLGSVVMDWCFGTGRCGARRCGEAALRRTAEPSAEVMLRSDGTGIAQLLPVTVKPARDTVLLRANLTATMRAGTPAGAGARRLRSAARGLAVKAGPLGRL